MKKKKLVLLVALLLILSFFAGSIFSKKSQRFYEVQSKYVYSIYHKFFKKEIIPLELSQESKKEKNIKYFNNFTIEMKKIDSMSFKALDKKNNKALSNLINQHRSAGFYITNKNEKLFYKIFTRDGHLITNNGIKKFKLPPTYDPHNGKGGLRGVFLFQGQSYGLMASEKIGCQYASVVNLEKSQIIFETDCLPDFSKIHYDALGGANLHFKDNILLSIGAPSRSSNLIRDLAQNKKSYFGKIISFSTKDLINKNVDESFKIIPEIFTMGHRNPQGLAKLNEYLFSSEHGPKGGDEINSIDKKNNYGWPVVSYGTNYDESSYLSKTYKYNHEKYGFIEPLYQFTPSIGISSLANCPFSLIKYFERKGCLLVNSLKNSSIYILLLDKSFQRVIGFEKLELGERLRNFANNPDGTLFEDQDGSIYVTTDKGNAYNLKFILKKDEGMNRPEF